MTTKKKDKAPSQIQIGDVVKLKSGSPQMTVGALDGDSDGARIFVCHWWDATKQQMFREPIHADALERLG